MGETIEYVDKGRIQQAAKDLLKVVVQVKGEKELRYAPQDPKAAYHDYGGRDSEKYSDIPLAIGPDKKFLGTEKDWNDLTASYSWITDMFDRHLDPDPKNIEPLSGPLRSIAGKLNFKLVAQPGQTPSGPTEPIAEYYRKVEGSVTNWTGPAAAQFKENFLAKLPSAAEAQAYLAMALALAIDGNRDMFLAIRRDLLTIAQQGAIAVARAGDCDMPFTSSQVRTTLTIVGAVATIAAGVASIPVTGGVLLPAGVAAFTVIAGVSSGLTAPDLGKKKTLTLDGNTVDGVLQKIVDAVIDASEEVTRKEDAMISALQGTITAITGESGKSYMPPRPDILDYSDTDLSAKTGYH